MTNAQPKSNLRGWVLVLALSAGIIVWGLANFLLVRDAPRRWDYGALPDAPGQSIYSSEAAPPGALVPRQVPALPEAVPKNPANPPAPERRSP